MPRKKKSTPEKPIKRRPPALPLDTPEPAHFGRLNPVWDALARYPDRTAIRLFCLLLLPVAVLTFYPSSGGDYDIWFHLAYGRHYVENLTWSIDHSQFSWTSTVPDWKYVTWIGSGLLYLAFLAGGIPGIFMLQWGVYLVVFGVLYAFLRHTGQRLHVWHVFSVLAVAVVHKLVGIYVKPELFSTLLFTVVVGLWFWIRLNPQRSGWAFVYPPLFLVWVNTHGGFFVGLFAVCLMLALDWLRYLINWKPLPDWRALTHLTVALLLCGPALLINPHGLDYHIAILSYLFDEAYFGAAKTLMAYISLWDFLWQWPIRSVNFVLSAWGMLFMGNTFLIWFGWAWVKKGCREPELLILNLFFFFFTMQSARNVVFYPMVWFFSMNYLVARYDMAILPKRGAGLVFPLYLILVAYIFYVTLVLLDSKTWFGYRLEHSWPEKEVAYIMEHKLPGPLFNDYFIGGYMNWTMYPEYKVWIDPRYGPFINQVLPDWNRIYEHFSTPENFAAFHARYPFNTALIHMAYPDLITAFMNLPDWGCLYFDKVAAVFIHHSFIDSLSDEAMDTSLNPDRYADLKHPAILFNLFVFYNNFGHHFAQQIRDIYAHNVSDWYKFKPAQLQLMDNAMAQRWGDGS